MYVALNNGVQIFNEAGDTDRQVHTLVRMNAAEKKQMVAGSRNNFV